MSIKIRRDTAANWSGTNPVLVDGQPGYDKTNRILKVGDGATAWNSLNGIAISVTWGSITGTLSSQTDLNTALNARLLLAGGTMTGPLITVASGTGAAGLNITPGTAPTSPNNGDIWFTGTTMGYRVNGTTYGPMNTNGAQTVTGKKTFSASTTGGAFINLAPGVAPSAPVDGDIWTTTAGIYAQINGSTVGPFGTGGGVSDGDKGDITVSSSGTVWTIDNGVVSLAKLADMATASVYYRKTGGTGAPEVQSLATLKTDLGLTGTNSGDQNTFSTISVSGQSDVVADSATDTLTLVAGSNITITTNAGTDTITIDAAGGSGASIGLVTALSTGAYY